MVLFIALFPMYLRGQFQKTYYGAGMSQYFEKVIQHGSEYYALGEQWRGRFNDRTDAVVCRIDAAGNLLWALSLEIPSQWNDAVLTPQGNLLLVGNTLPKDENSQSLIGLVTPTGTFSWVYAFDAPGRDFFCRIVRNPTPSNPAFPYYVLGSQWDPSGAWHWDDVVLLTFDEKGNVGEKVLYDLNFSNDEFCRDLEVLPDGDLIISGNRGFHGVIFRLNNSFRPIDGLITDSLTYVDVAPAGRHFFTVGRKIATPVHYLTKLDQNSLPLWEVRLPLLTNIYQVWAIGTAIYVTGSADVGGLDRDVVLKFQDGTTGPTLLWLKYLDPPALVRGRVWPLSSTTMGFVGSQLHLADGPSPAVLAVTDLDFHAGPYAPPCIILHPHIDIVRESLLRTPTTTDIRQVVDVPPPKPIAWVPEFWKTALLCEYCNVFITTTFIDNCGQVQLKAVPIFSAPVGYQWSTGANTPSINATLPCGTHTFSVTITCANGTTATASTIVNAIDSIPPVALCKKQIPPLLLGDKCEVVVTPSMVDAGSFDNCQIQSLAVSPEVIKECGTFVVTLTATDGCGNTSTCTTPITVKDHIVPIIACPPNLTVSPLPKECFYSGPLPSPQSADNCPGLQVVCVWANLGAQEVVSPTTKFPKGTHTITCRVRDRCGNSNECSFTLTVVDNEPPTITCPPSLTVAGQINPAGICAATVQDIGAVVNDNCPMAHLTWTMTGATTGSGSGSASGTTFLQGTTTVTYTATDMAGNVATCSFTVTVNCLESPTAHLCGQAVVTCFSGLNQPANPAAGVNVNGPVMGIYDVRNHSIAPLGAHWSSVGKTMFPNWTAARLGQVFGIALGPNEEIFVAASTVYTCSHSNFSYISPFGPAGGGGIYRIDPSNGVHTVFTKTGPFTPGTNNIPNTGAGLGNFCYDPDHDQFFVTNMTDGMIYRVRRTTSGAGIVLDRFDPFGQVNPPSTGTGADPNFVALGERTWGIGYYRGRVYFSRWSEDKGRPSFTAANQIWSIGLTPSGAFTATNSSAGTFWGGEVLEIDMGSYNFPGPAYSNPISDIEFSSTGKMLIAERTMVSDCGGVLTTQFFNYAHYARVIEFEKMGSTWTLTPGHTTPLSASSYHLKFEIGNTASNSAGGVDYGYEWFTPPPYALPPAPCDSMLWCTGDNLSPAGGGMGSWIYGMQGIRSSGQDNNPPSPTDNSNSVLIDFDNDLITHDKVLIGDVDVIKCGCPLTEPPFPCDSLRVVKNPLNVFEPGTPSDNSCCWSVDLHVNAGPVAYLEVKVLTPGVTFANVSVSSSFTLIATQPTQLTIKHNPFQGIPFGTYPGALTFCLNNITNLTQVPQVLAFCWYVKGPTDVPYLACVDTCYFQCLPPVVVPDTCVAIKNDTLICDPSKPGTYTYLFQVQNLSNFAANQVVLSNPSSGVLFQPCPPPSNIAPANSITLPQPPLMPGIPPDSCSPTLCVQLIAPPITTPTWFTFNTTLFGGNNCCHATDKDSILLRPCCDPCKERRVVVRTLPPADSCCHSVDIVNPCYSNFFTKLEVALLTPGVCFGSHFTNGSGWFNPISTPTSIQWQYLSGNIPSGTWPGLINFCLDKIDMPSEVPQVVVIRWITVGANGADSVACTDTLKFECPVVDQGCIEVIEDHIQCEKDAQGNIFYSYTLSFQNASTPPHSADGIIFSQISGPPVVVSPNPSNLIPSLPWGSTATVSLGIYPSSGPLPAGTMLCFSGRLFDNTSGDHWCCFEPDTVCIIIPRCDSCVCTRGIALLTSGETSWKMVCNSTYLLPVLSCPPADVGVSPSLGCISSQNQEPCEFVMHWELTGPNVFQTGSNPPASIVFPASVVGKPGKYCLTSWTVCPGASETCRCQVCWIQPECFDICCHDYLQFITQVKSAISINHFGGNTYQFVISPSLGFCTYIEWINWGDGTPTQYGPFFAGSVVFHTYGSSGAYPVEYLAIQTNPATGFICFEYLDSLTATVSTRDLWLNGPVRLYPNPTAGEFTLELPTAVPEGTTLRITDPIGRLVQEVALPSGGQQYWMNAAHLPAGLYLLHIVSEGRPVRVLRFVKQ